ncbi:MAG: serine/threonine protein kinase [Myxococcales bacterium]|nr:serine/threonine protein kinase [Myxococcales bacterium]
MEARLGRGGAAEVYRCRRGRRTTEQAAVKLLRDGLGPAQPQVSRRFHREAQILRSLTHPNIVSIREVSLRPTRPWLVMDLVRGRSCSWFVRTGPASPTLVARVARGLLSALGYLHERGIAHRDVKPANVILGRGGHAVLVDFGLALDQSLGRLSAPGSRLGSLHTMPPEWATGDRSTPEQAWDVYGAGQLLYELLAGEPAFPYKLSPREVVDLKRQQRWLDPGREVPDALRALVCDLTAADPEKRLESGVVAARRSVEVTGKLGL